MDYATKKEPVVKRVERAQMPSMCGIYAHSLMTSDTRLGKQNYTYLQPASNSTVDVREVIGCFAEGTAARAAKPMIAFMGLEGYFRLAKCTYLGDQALVPRLV